MFGQAMPFLSNQARSSIKTLVFDSQSNFNSTSIEHQISADAQYIDLTQPIQRFQKALGKIAKYEYRIYDPTVAIYVELPQNRVVRAHFFLSPIVMLRYRKISEDSDAQSSSSLASNDSRKERNKERTIWEVIECVKKWRAIHNGLDDKRGKTSLQDAAKIVGVSKKSLDDYFYQLRLAEQLNFDFMMHLDEKIGVLRSFVRQHKSSAKELEGVEKNTRRLKIIENDGFFSTQIQKNIQKTEEVQPVLENMQQQPMQHYVSPNQDVNEMQFYETFLQENELSDPFVTFREMDFRKKQQDFEDFQLIPW